ncbi:hypothetical protein VIGAN_06086200 [Vigna angularis var. angularis]|uniref:Uncharacterized protein n=1 Tax=Vigna angularis var. angularis TaxID=157739 RepID=A0A0S3SAA7_PHAAN|nr:hypothetical protein VIGAN_06086200 [Vigna angularis var. angularis]
MFASLQPLLSTVVSTILFLLLMEIEKPCYRLLSTWKKLLWKRERLSPDRNSLLSGTLDWYLNTILQSVSPMLFSVFLWCWNGCVWDVLSSHCFPHIAMLQYFFKKN